MLSRFGPLHTGGRVLYHPRHYIWSLLSLGLELLRGWALRVLSIGPRLLSRRMLLARSSRATRTDHGPGNVYAARRAALKARKLSVLPEVSIGRTASKKALGFLVTSADREQLADADWEGARGPNRPR